MVRKSHPGFNKQALTVMNETSSKFVKCTCQQCDGKIEFDTNRMGETIACPHCGLKTTLFVPSAKPELPNPNPTSTNSKSVSVEIKQGVYALGIASFILGIIACVFYWTPFLEPFFAWIALVGLALAVTGLILARVNNRTGFVFPIIGLVICLLPLTIDVTVIGGSAVMKRLANWREQREAQRQLATAAKAQAEAHWRALPNLAKAQMEAYQSDLRNVATAEFQVNVCQTNITIEEAAKKAAVEQAQQQLNQAKSNYDRFMATNPLLTNAVYVKIKKDLAFRTGLTLSLPQTITYLTQELKKPYSPQTWIIDSVSQNGQRNGHRAGATQAEQAEQKQAVRERLADAKKDLANAYAQIPRDQQTLAQIEGDVVAFQESKLHDAESALAAAVAGAKLTDAELSLVAANQHLDECKDQDAKSSAAAKSALEEYRSATFPSSK